MPLLDRWDWPIAPSGLKPSSPVILTKLQLVAWRISATELQDIKTLYAWFPKGILKAADLRAHKPWGSCHPGRLEPVASFALGQVAARPLKRAKIFK